MRMIYIYHRDINIFVYLRTVAMSHPLNGRVSHINDKVCTQFDFSNTQQTHQSFEGEATKGIHAANEVSGLFFSAQNIDALQHGIRYGVYKKTCGKYVIGNQSLDELKIIMRSIYLQYSENLPYKILEQVRSLNARVLDYAIKQITKELDMYATYRKDQASLPMPMERSANVSNTGLRSNEFKSFM